MHSQLNPKMYLKPYTLIGEDPYLHIPLHYILKPGHTFGSAQLLKIDLSLLRHQSITGSREPCKCHTCDSIS